MNLKYLSYWVRGCVERSLALAVMRLTCVREVHSSNLARALTIHTEVFSRLLHSPLGECQDCILKETRGTSFHILYNG